MTHQLEDTESIELTALEIDTAGSTEQKFSQVSHAHTLLPKERDISTTLNPTHAAIAVVLSMDVAS